MSGAREIQLPPTELDVSFEYQCSPIGSTSSMSEQNDIFSNAEVEGSSGLNMKSSSFSCLSGAALSANATLANTNVYEGLIGQEILPSLDSPTSFRRLASSPSLSRLDLLASSYQENLESLSLDDNRTRFWRSASLRADSSGFLNAVDIQTAGGAAGEDRVQAVCSEERGLLFCGIYDGFSGRDAADFLAGTLYDNIITNLERLEESRMKQDDGSNENSVPPNTSRNEEIVSPQESTSENFGNSVMDCLVAALAKAEDDFLCMVEREMRDRPDLVSVGSCVLVGLLYGNDFYVLNLGDSRAVLATTEIEDHEGSKLKAIQLTEIHSVDNEKERKKIWGEHPDDPYAIISGRVKGRVKVTRAVGVGYLKRKKMNEALMGILRIRKLSSPPYICSEPFSMIRQVTQSDQFIVFASDGLFDFFSNKEIVAIVQSFILHHPSGDPARHLIEQLVLKVADNAGFSTEELMNIPVGRRRNYHDDVSIIVVILGNKQRTTSASTHL